MTDFDELKQMRDEMERAGVNNHWKIVKLNSDRDIAIELVDEPGFSIVYPEGLMTEADARYIVALHNAADELIRLAERAQKLEMDNADIYGAMLTDASNAEGLQVTLVQLEERVRKLEEALRVYADPKNWSRSSRFVHSVVFTGKLRLKDIYGGAIAHRAMRSAVK